jgi:hypothetical protein
MSEDLKTYRRLLVIAAVTTSLKISEKLHLCMVRLRQSSQLIVRKKNPRSLCSSLIRTLLTKVAIGSCHVEQDQIAKGLLLGDRHRNYRLGTPLLYKRGLIRGIWT